MIQELEFNIFNRFSETKTLNVLSEKLKTIFISVLSVIFIQKWLSTILCDLIVTISSII